MPVLSGIFVQVFPLIAHKVYKDTHPASEPSVLSSCPQGTLSISNPHPPIDCISKPTTKTVFWVTLPLSLNYCPASKLSHLFSVCSPQQPGDPTTSHASFQPVLISLGVKVVLLNLQAMDDMISLESSVTVLCQPSLLLPTTQTLHKYLCKPSFLSTPEHLKHCFPCLELFYQTLSPD